MTVSKLAVSMKTTIGLPESLVTEVKVRAVKERRTLKDVTAEALRLWLDGGVKKRPQSKIGLSLKESSRLAAMKSLERQFSQKEQKDTERVALNDYLEECLRDRQQSGGAK